MATRRPFWKWHIWKSIGFFPYTIVMCYWSLDLIFKAKQKLESGNRKIQDGCQAAILKVTLLKINRLLPVATNNMHMKFLIEIPKQTWVTLRKPCRLQTDRQTDRQTDKVIPVYPPPTSLGGGKMNSINTSPMSTAYVRRETMYALVQVMARRLFGAKPLPEPMLTYCQLNPWKETSVQSESKFKTFNSWKCIGKCCLRNDGHFVQGEMS